jgi:myo-inositol-1(or 4)-monophosphatase
MTDADNSPDDLWLAAARDAAAVAAAFIAERAATRASLVWEAKTATDFVSEVDIGAEERIRSMLTARIPGLRVIGEELGPEGDASHGLVAIVDPLDGTTNFLHGFPAYGVSIAIAMDGVPRVGVVHDVARGGVYWAVAGRGAFFNDQPIHVSTNDQPERALIGTGLPFKDMTHADLYLRQLRHLMPIVAGMRRAGSAALDLCDVACGRFEGFWELKLARGISPQDCSSCARPAAAQPTSRDVTRRLPTVRSWPGVAPCTGGCLNSSPSPRNALNGTRVTR